MIEVLSGIYIRYEEIKKIGDEVVTFGKLLRCLSVGFLFGIFAIGLLPFLIIVNWIELFSLTEYEASPLYVLFSHVTGQRAVSGKKERDKDLETNKSEPETHEG